MKVVFLLFISFFLYLAPVQAQQQAKQARSSTQAQQPSTQATKPVYTLQQQFNGMKSRSSSHQEFNRDYKVIRVDHLDRFWKNVQDSVKGQAQSIRKVGAATEQALVKARQELKAQQALIQDLKKDNEQKDKAIQKTAHDVESLSVFGLDMNKQLYVILSWVIFLGLGALALVLLVLYRKGKVVADEKIKAYDLIAQEYKEHKQNAREREIKIKRELQTEINRVEELTQQVAQLKRPTF